ncbi:MAG: phage major capsid protein [Ruminococcus sp.]|nr:phage major capsid protein [Ruminococcus sp.]
MNPKKNRWQLASMRDGFADSLEEARAKLTQMLGDSKSTAEQRAAQQNIVSDLADRLERAIAEIEAFDKAAEEADRERSSSASAAELPENVRITNGYAQLIRATMNKMPIGADIKNALLDDTAATGGSSFLPKTVSDQLIVEPLVKNPLRDHSTYTSIMNLEVPRLDFSTDNDDFIEDGAVGKEIKTKGSTVAFGRNKFKVFSEISETILNGSNIDLTSYVTRGLTAGLAAKEKKVAFTQTPKTGEEHMSFYDESVGIKVMKSNTLFNAIRQCIADMDDDFDVEVCMRKSDYLEIVDTLANGNASLYAAPPESILGVPVFFCNQAVKPIIGDFRYSHFNYGPDITYDRDKDVKTGMNVFVITAWFDHQIKLASAFRIAEVASV